MPLSSAALCFLLLAWAPAQPKPNSQPSGVIRSADQQQNQPGSIGNVMIDAAKEADIRKLMQISGAEAIARQMMDRTSQTLKPLMINGLPPGGYREKLVDLFFAKFQSKMDIQQLLDMAVPIYDKYFSHEEIKGLIQFYQTPLGQKALTVLPKLTAEMSDAGRQWGQQLGRDSMQEVLAEHPDLAKALADAGKQRP